MNTFHLLSAHGACFVHWKGKLQSFWSQMKSYKVNHIRVISEALEMNMMGL